MKPEDITGIDSRGARVHVDGCICDYHEVTQRQWQTLKVVIERPIFRVDTNCEVHKESETMAHCPLCPRSHKPSEPCVEAVPFPSTHIPLIVDGVCANCGKSIRETSPWQWTHYVGEYYCNGYDITSRDYAHPDRETIGRIRELRR